MPLRPLEGFAVGITADRRWAEQADLLERRGARVIHGPTITTQYLGHDDALRAATETVIAGPPDYLVATTGIGVRAWFEAAQAWGLAERLLEALGSSRVVARGAKAAAAIQVAGLEPWAIPPSERLDDVVTLLAAEPLPGRVIAFQHYGDRDDEAVSSLSGAGATVVEVPVYRYRVPDDRAPASALIDGVCAGRVDAVTFTSAPAVASLIALARGHGRRDELLDAFNESGVVAACVGPVCAESAHREGIRQPVAPSRGRLGLLVRALTDALQARRRRLRCGTIDVVVQGRAVAVDGVPVALTPGEQAVLTGLLRRPGAVVARPVLLRTTGAGPTSPRALEVTVERLRRRLGPAGGALQAVRGRGYRFNAVEQPPLD